MPLVSSRSSSSVSWPPRTICSRASLLRAMTSSGPMSSAATSSCVEPSTNAREGRASLEPKGRPVQPLLPTGRRPARRGARCCRAPAGSSSPGPSAAWTCGSSPDLRQEQTDQEIAEEEAGGTDVIALPADTWEQISRAGQAPELLDVAEVGGLIGATRWLDARVLEWSRPSPAVLRQGPRPRSPQTVREPCGIGQIVDVTAASLLTLTTARHAGTVKPVKGINWTWDEPWL